MRKGWLNKQETNIKEWRLRDRIRYELREVAATDN